MQEIEILENTKNEFLVRNKCESIKLAKDFYHSFKISGFTQYFYSTVR